MIIRNLFVSPVVAIFSALISAAALAGNVHITTDAQDIPFGGTNPVGPNPSGYDVQSITYTLDEFDTLTVEIVPFGVPGDADGDGNPDVSSNAAIQDAPGVGPTEQVRMILSCSDPANCSPDVQLIYTNNALSLIGSTDPASMSVDANAYTLTIPNFTAFKSNLGGTPAAFGSFSISLSVTDLSPADFVPDAVGSCEAISLEPPVVAKTPFDCYAVNKVKVKDKDGTDSDKIKITKAGFRLDAPNTVDLSTDEVEIRIDGLALQFPPGSFEQKGDKPDYVFKSATGVKPKVEARLRFDKATWELNIKDGDASLIDNSDGVDVALMIGDFESTENVVLDYEGEFEREPKVSCRHATSDSSDDGVPGTNKLSCLSSVTVQHSSGALITKTRAGAELLHPNTVFADDATGDMAIVHTSCSACLQCGDVNGNFTIVEIDGLPGDTMAQQCAVPDASCSILPPE